MTGGERPTPLHHRNTKMITRLPDGTFKVSLDGEVRLCDTFQEARELLQDMEDELIAAEEEVF